MDTSDIFNVDEALNRIPGGLDVVKEMGGLLLSECQKLMGQLQTAVAKGDAAEVKRAGHTMKGSAGVFAAQHVVAAAARLEEMGRDGNLADAAEACAVLEQELTRLREAMIASSIISKS